jgi:hypothetical protein
MHTQRSTDDPADLVSWAFAANTALGTLVFMLFPFALPILLLTAAFLAPLVILLLPIAILAAIWLALRGIGRRVAAARAAMRVRSGEGASQSHHLRFGAPAWQGRGRRRVLRTRGGR